MPEQRERVGGRRAQFDLDDIVSAGLRVGLPGLSVQAVASILGVSPTAVYRLVPGRVALERLIGEAVLAGLELVDDPAMSSAEHLVDFTMKMRAFTLANPGSAAYFQHSFPRGASGARLMAAEVAALTARGYEPNAAAGLCGAVASLALGLLSAEDARLARAAEFADPEEETANTIAAILDDPLLAAAHAGIPAVGPDEYFLITMTGAVRGLVDLLPPGRPLGELLAATRNAMPKETEN
ncbi:hypothetical protein AB0I28_01015 [Phytomonospora sp. NPDC050363]|uniref:hypothetical protein n=1 Tax=Phytomonospora sp. NPDC050363 TaxID=3155642 RepID=UPI0033C7EFB3